MAEQGDRRTCRHLQPPERLLNLIRRDLPAGSSANSQPACAGSIDSGRPMLKSPWGDPETADALILRSCEIREEEVQRHGKSVRLLRGVPR